MPPYAPRVPIDVTHPRPTLQRGWTSLDGEWELSLDPDGACDDPSDPAFADRITVPYAPETPASGIAADGFVQRCWYRRRLDTEPAGEGERVLLHFGGVDRIADVWVGGHHVAHHVGGYSAFSVDVTAHARAGAEVVVRAVDDAADLDAPRGKQDWQAVSHAIWYPRTTGIWKTVWLERVHETHVAEVTWTPDADAMAVTLHARIEGPRPAGLALGVVLRVGDRVLVDDRIGVTGADVQRTFPLGDQGFDDRIDLLWWPARPTLVEAELALHDGDRIVDEARSYTALRSVEVVDGRFRLNGRPYRLRLVLDQGYWPETGATPPDVDALRRDIELTKALGFNGARKHQKTEDLRYFALADQLGLLTWVEMPSAYRPGPRSASALVAEWSEVVRAHRNHPSVVAWVPVNESWGVPDCEHEPRQRALIAALRDLTGALDGTRPVSANDGWETVGGDLVGIHDYDQDAERVAARYADDDAVDRLLTGRRTDGKVADLEQRPAGRRAVVLSEFGGVAMAGEAAATGFGLGTDAWGYDTASSEDELLSRYRELWAAVRASTSLSGACWTQLTDTYQEVNGLLRADRTPKGDLDAFRAATRGR